MRGLIPELQSTYPLASSLPAVYLEDHASTTATGDAGAAPWLQLPIGSYTATIGEGDLPKDAVASDPRGDVIGTWMLHVTREPTDTSETLALTLIREGETMAMGTLTCSADVVSVTTANCGADAGRYKWRFDGNSLALSALEDACTSRQVLLTTRPWLRRNFATRFVSAFDEELAPVLCALDNLEAYVDPRLAPADFVDWISGWVGLSPTQKWPLRRRRDRIARAVQVALSLGTVEGIRDVVSIFTGVEPINVEITDNGGIASSATPGGQIPGTSVPEITVRLKVADPSQLDAELLERVVVAAKPAHVLHKVEVVTDTSARASGQPEEAR
jgi:phage tail-like protein